MTFQLAIQKQTTIYLNPEEAEAFKIFRQFQNDFMLLTKSKFFELKNGECLIYKENGKIKDISIKKNPVKKGKLID